MKTRLYSTKGPMEAGYESFKARAFISDLVDLMQKHKIQIYCPIGTMLSRSTRPKAPEVIFVKGLRNAKSPKV